VKSINDVMPMIGARFYTQLDATQVRCDVLQGELAKVTHTIKFGHFKILVSAPFWDCFIIEKTVHPSRRQGTRLA
jgi:hypothetical protein